jgi:menaquinone-dependent protoporphyrinogen IX oxidase
MGGIADVFDARENPDLSSFDAIVVGTGIYSGKIDHSLETYLAKNAALISNRIKALFVVCGGGDTPRAQEYINALAKSCGAKPPLTKVFSGRLTKKLLNAPDYKIEEEVAKRQNHPFEDYDNLQRKDCLKFGEEILTKNQWGTEDMRKRHSPSRLEQIPRRQPACWKHASYRFAFKLETEAAARSRRRRT